MEGTWWKEKIELLANTVAFISSRHRLIEVLAGATRGERGSKGGGGRVRLSDVRIERLSGLKYKLICHFKLATDMVGGGIMELEIANLKWHINLYFNPDSLLVSISSNLTWPPPTLTFLFPLVATANTLVSLHLQQMKSTMLAESSILSIIIKWNLTIVFKFNL